MKTCPKCNRTFPDEGQKFCTFDGGLLIAPQPFDPNATMRATSIDLKAPSERPTSRDLPDPNATIIENYPATVALPRNTGPTGAPTNAPNTADFAKPAPPPPITPPPPQERQSQQFSQAPPPPAPQPPPPAPVQHTSAPLAPPQAQAPVTSAPLPAPPTAQKKSKMPLIIGGVLVFLLLAGGALAGFFFFVVKPRLDQMAAERNPNPPVVQPTAEPAQPAPTVEQAAPTPEEFVAPPDSVQFQNAATKLDGKLAEHYFDFSFYYPKSWKLDPKAGVPGASNFVKVERSLPPNFPQENFGVGWYTSTGTFVGDLRTFPERVEEFSALLAKAFPEYRKVSEGPTKVNSMQGYEFRWEGLSKGTERGDIHLWGRVIFLPTGNEGDTSGATLTMLCTSLAPELLSVDDVGEKGQAPIILESFRFGKKQ